MRAVASTSSPAGGGTILGFCSGTVIQSGKATVTWDPTQPPIFRLSCG